MATCLSCGNETGSPYAHICDWCDYIATHATVGEALEREAERMLRNGGV